MGQITSQLESDNNLTIVKVVGEVTAKQVLSQITSFLSGEPTPLVLWDIREGSLGSIAPKDLRMIVEKSAPLAERRKGGKTALLCLRDLDFGFSRMFQTFAELYHIPFDIQVFRDLEDAKTWLGIGTKG